MTFTKHPYGVTIELTHDDFEQLLLIVGFAAGAAKAQGEDRMFWGWIDFANRINRTNPNFTPYEIPQGALEPK